MFRGSNNYALTTLMNQGLQTRSPMLRQPIISSAMQVLPCAPSAQSFKFSTSLQMQSPKPKNDHDSNQEGGSASNNAEDRDGIVNWQHRPNIFRSSPIEDDFTSNQTNESSLKQLRKQNNFDASTTAAFDDHDSFRASNSGLNVCLAAFYSLPKLGKEESESILQELRVDMDHQWTPSKLVAELDKHIVSQKKAKRVIAQAVRNKYRMR